MRKDLVMTCVRRFGERLGRASVVGVGVAGLVAVAGCAGSSGQADDQPTTSFHYLINPLDPGSGFVQLGKNRYVFDGVICATGRVKSDPAGSVRVFGVYANFHVNGQLAAVSMTRYRNEVRGKVDTIPTLTETVLVEMQGDKEVRGLAASRYQIVGARKWQDRHDPSVTSALIVRTGDRYEAKGTFAPLGDDTGSTSGTSTTTATGTVLGDVAARCPAKGTVSTTTSLGATTSVPNATTTTPTSLAPSSSSAN